MFLEREIEIKSLKCRLEESRLSQEAIWQQLCSLTERESKLRKDLQILENKEKDIKNQIVELWKVPSLFLVNDVTAAVTEEYSEEN